jgi:hypothetical protein
MLQIKNIKRNIAMDGALVGVGSLSPMVNYICKFHRYGM